MQLFKGESNFDFIGRRKQFAAVSIALVLGSLVAIATLGFNMGIDFAGGYELQVRFPQGVEEGDIRKMLEPLNLADARVQRFGSDDANEYLILVRETGTISNEQKQQLKADFEKLAGGADGLTQWSVAESGENVRVGFSQAVTEDQVRSVLQGYNVQVKSITRGDRDDAPDFRIELVSIADQIGSVLSKAADVPAGQSVVQRVEFVGPQVGEQLRNQGILAVLYSLVFILIYIALRFDFYFAPGAIVGLVHDVIITLGCFAIFRLEFNLQAVAALLTLVGYSLNDTIVVYDRVRENLARLRGRDIEGLVNTSINQTLPRTILTSGTTLLVCISLIAFGGVTLRDFAIALAIGIGVGTYSSVAIASSVYIWLRERYAAGSTTSSVAAA